MMKRQRATALILNNEENILLCVEAPDNKDYLYKSQRDFLYMPGGAIENSETPEQAVRREVKEELDLEVTKLTYLFDYETSIQVYKVFLVELSDKPCLTENLKYIGYYNGELNKLGSQPDYPELSIGQISNATMGIIREYQLKLWKK